MPPDEAAGGRVPLARRTTGSPNSVSARLDRIEMKLELIRAELIRNGHVDPDHDFESEELP